MKRGGPLKRTPLGHGAKSRERGSTFATRGNGLKRSSSKPKRRAISPASTAQRVKIMDADSIVSGQQGVDPAHLISRAQGGCDDSLCIVPLTREEHRAYDEGRLDLLPYLIDAGCTAELQHALEHCNGSLLMLLERVTNRKWASGPLIGLSGTAGQNAPRTTRGVGSSQGGSSSVPAESDGEVLGG